MIAVDTTGKPIVIGPIDRHCPGRTGTIGRRRRNKIQTFKIPTLLRGGRDGLKLLKTITFSTRYCIEMRIGAGNLAAVEAANGRTTTRLETISGANPAGPRAPPVDARSLTGVGGDEIVIQIGVIEGYVAITC